MIFDLLKVTGCLMLIDNLFGKESSIELFRMLIFSNLSLI
jgi:hypothetical protein